MAQYGEKSQTDKEVIEPHNGYGSENVDEEVGVVHKSGSLARDLKSRHMQMIAIGTISNISSASISSCDRELTAWSF
jgi:amino acid permease